MKYDIIYIDPAWEYARTGGQACVTKYKRMKDADVYNMPINKIASDNCALLCWMTFPKLAEGVRAIESWGFEIKTIFINWVKLNKTNIEGIIDKDNKPFFGVGTYPKSNGEICMLCSKGNVASLLPPRKSQVDSLYDGKLRDDTISSILLHPRLRHSEKPPKARERIDKIFRDDLNKIEVFARKRVDNWDAIGYGVDGMDIGESLGLVINDKYNKEEYSPGENDI